MPGLTPAYDQNNVGTRNHTRRFISSFNTGADAAFVISDSSDDEKFWQMATLQPNAITTAGNTFTITSPKGDSLKGTVLYPSAVTFKAGPRARGSEAVGIKDDNFIHFNSEDGHYLVVLTLFQKGQPHPAVATTSTWDNSPKDTVTVGKFAVSIAGDQVSYPGAK